MNKKIKCNFIVCGSAVGKTFLAQADNRFIDLDELKATYKYGLNNKSRKELENGKMRRGELIKNDSYEYIINTMNEIISNNKIGLLSHNDKVIQYLIDNNIPYGLIYPSKNSRLEYIKRMRNRCNNDLFINEMTNINNWNNFYKMNKNDKNATYKIKLKKEQYLFDIKNIFI